MLIQWGSVGIGLGEFNATFLALISKTLKHVTFRNFRSISLCMNLFVKIISNKLKLGLSRGISKEQFVFLSNWQILDAIGTTKECIHTVKTKNLSWVVMKLDLAKVYDKLY